MENEQEDKGAEENLSFDELSMLKQRAKLMGITHSNNISLETLRAKIADAQSGKDDTPTEPETELFTPMGETIPRKAMTLRQMLHKNQMKLVRLRIQNLDPKKKDLPGEIFTVANEYIGSVKKYIPYGEAGNSYHVPYCIYNRLKKRQFLNIRTFQRNGQVQVETKWAREFSLEVLEPLTERERRELATTQAASHALS